MKGYLLNEDGFVTYPYEVLQNIEHYVKSLKWKIKLTDHNHYDDRFPFDNSGYQLMNGTQILQTLKKYSDVQWIWGVLSGFPNEISWDEIKIDSYEYDITEDSPYMRNGLTHIESKAVFELIAIDSSETLLLIDDEAIAKQLQRYFPYMELIEVSNVAKSDFK